MSTRNHARNELPPGASLIDPRETKQLGSYVPLLYDAVVEQHGVLWYRVYRGLGGRGDREDWIAGLEGKAASVHDYHWNGESFGPDYGTFSNACLQELRNTRRYIREELEEKRKEVAELERTLAVLENLPDGAG